jgi:hypothetical protein
MLRVPAHFAILDEPRAANARHELSEIMFIAIAATLAGAKTCVEMAEFGEAKGGCCARCWSCRTAFPRTTLSLPAPARADVLGPHGLEPASSWNGLSPRAQRPLQYLLHSATPP